MVKVKPISGPSSNSSYVLLAVKILLVLIILFLLPKLAESGSDTKSRRKRAEVEYRGLRNTCETQACYSWIPEESLNCVFACMSPSCYNQLYGLSFLEDGEIDIDRAREFESCTKSELRAARKRRRDEVLQRNR